MPWKVFADPCYDNYYVEIKELQSEDSGTFKLLYSDGTTETIRGEYPSGICETMDDNDSQ